VALRILKSELSLSAATKSALVEKIRDDFSEILKINKTQQKGVI
jgi:hypothetical protein